MTAVVGVALALAACGLLLLRWAGRVEARLDQAWEDDGR